jgi:hypothetical protein
MARKQNKAAEPQVENDVLAAGEGANVEIRETGAGENGTPENGTPENPPAETGAGDAAENGAGQDSTGQDSTGENPPGENPPAVDINALALKACTGGITPEELKILILAAGGKTTSSVVAAITPTPALGAVTAKEAAELPAEVRRKYLAQHAGPFHLALQFADAAAAENAAAEIARKYGAGVSIHTPDGTDLIAFPAGAPKPAAAPGTGETKPKGEGKARPGGLTDDQWLALAIAYSTEDGIGGVLAQDLQDATRKLHAYSWPPTLRGFEPKGFRFDTYDAPTGRNKLYKLIAMTDAARALGEQAQAEHGERARANIDAMRAARKAAAAA